MISLLKCWFRYILALCLIAVIFFMMACTILVAVLIVNGNIKIRKIAGNREKK